jgi:hypothetical protein
MFDRRPLLVVPVNGLMTVRPTNLTPPSRPSPKSFAPSWRRVPAVPPLEPAFCSDDVAPSARPAHSPGQDRNMSTAAADAATTRAGMPRIWSTSRPLSCGKSRATNGPLETRPSQGRRCSETCFACGGATTRRAGDTHAVAGGGVGGALLRRSAFGDLLRQEGRDQDVRHASIPPSSRRSAGGQSRRWPSTSRATPRGTTGAVLATRTRRDRSDELRTSNDQPGPRSAQSGGVSGGDTGAPDPVNLLQSSPVLPNGRYLTAPSGRRPATAPPCSHG